MNEALTADAVESTELTWGVAKWLITVERHRSTMSLGEVIVLPGQSHEWHNHEESDEIVYVLSGRGSFTVGEGNSIPIVPGDALHIPVGVFHDSHNDGWAPLHLLVMYSPGGPEGGTPDNAHAIHPAGESLVMHTSVEDPGNA
ncbi:MAG TPA: cupin domain-containing protein [Microbacteriaceae bacterium]|jgi:quercetin dioxygenase-like cupin family protein|nr:cupin domain-containing protein [Microbacteriaceae bacterium]